jgi:hypothetical protein
VQKGSAGVRRQCVEGTGQMQAIEGHNQWQLGPVAWVDNISCTDGLLSKHHTPCNQALRVHNHIRGHLASSSRDSSGPPASSLTPSQTPPPPSLLLLLTPTRKPRTPPLPCHSATLTTPLPHAQRHINNPSQLTSRLLQEIPDGHILHPGGRSSSNSRAAACPGDPHGASQVPAGGQRPLHLL